MLRQAQQPQERPSTAFTLVGWWLSLSKPPWRLPLYKVLKRAFRCFRQAQQPQETPSTAFTLVAVVEPVETTVAFAFVQGSK